MTDKEVLKLADEKLKEVGFSGYSFWVGTLGYGLLEKKIRDLKEELELIRCDGGNVEGREKQLAKYLAVKQFCEDNDFLGAAKRKRNKTIIITLIISVVVAILLGLGISELVEEYEASGPHGVIVTW